jgi:hypothetical protein
VSRRDLAAPLCAPMACLACSGLACTSLLLLLLPQPQVVPAACRELLCEKGGVEWAAALKGGPAAVEVVLPNGGACA